MTFNGHNPLNVNAGRILPEIGRKFRIMQKLDCTCTSLIFTTRIRRMGEDNIFTLCISPHLNGSGWVPRPRSGQEGYSILVPDRGWMGYPPSGTRCGTPRSGTGWGIPTQDWMEYLTPRTGWGTLPPPRTGWDTLPPPLDRTA